MDKQKIITELSKRLNLSEDKCSTIENIVGNKFLSGKINKEEIIKELIKKIGVDEKTADKIYNTAMDILKKGLQDKLFNPFKS